MTLRLATFLAIAIAALHSIFAMAELREDPLPIVSCIDIQTELQEAVEQGTIEEHEAQEVLDRCNRFF